MKIRLVSVNSQFSHTSLAVRYLKAYNQKKGIQTEFREYTINHNLSQIVADLYSEKADVYGFSTYIFNVSEVRAVTEDLKKLLPGSVIFCGGPEVSYDYFRFLDENRQVDFVLRGEGEETVAAFLECVLRTGTQQLKKFLAAEELPGVSFLYEGKRFDGPDRAPLCDLDAIPFPYDETVEEIKEKILYYESARGCPFRCSYCMSSLEKTVRSFSRERIFSDLHFFLEHRVRLVKFVDRTFNYDKKRALEILKFISNNDNGYTSFHFEIAVWLLDAETLDFLDTVREGLFRFEIGIQSTNPQTLAAINRKQDVLALRDTFTRLSLSSVHVHTDLIAGLPYEDFQRFGRSFNDAMSLRPDVLQLGFLKILKGTEISGQLEHGQVFSAQPPYEILYNHYIRYDELVFLKKIEQVHEWYYNSGLCRHTLGFCAEKLNGDYFGFYSGFVSFLLQEDFFRVSHKTPELFDILYRYIGEQLKIPAFFAEYLAFDLYSFAKVCNPPVWLANRPEKELWSHCLSDEQFLLSRLPAGALELLGNDCLLYTSRKIIPTCSDMKKAMVA